MGWFLSRSDAVSPVRAVARPMLLLCGVWGAPFLTHCFCGGGHFVSGCFNSRLCDIMVSSGDLVCG